MTSTTPTVNCVYVYLRTLDQQQELFAPDFESFLAASSALSPFAVEAEAEQLELWNTPVARDNLRIQLKGTRGVRFEQPVGLLMDSCHLIRKLIVWHFVFAVSHDGEGCEGESAIVNIPLISLVLPYFDPENSDIDACGKFRITCKTVKGVTPLVGGESPFTCGTETTCCDRKAPILTLNISNIKVQANITKKPLDALFLLELFRVDEKPIVDGVIEEMRPSPSDLLLDSDILGMIFVYLRRRSRVVAGAKPPPLPPLFSGFVQPKESNTGDPPVDATSDELTHSQKRNIVDIITSLRMVPLYSLLAGLRASMSADSNILRSDIEEAAFLSAIRSDSEETAKLIDKTLIISKELHRQKQGDNCVSATYDSNLISQPSNDEWVQSFRQKVRGLGCIDDTIVAYQSKLANGDNGLSALATTNASNQHEVNDVYSNGDNNDDNNDDDGNFILSSSGLGGAGCFKCGRSDHKPDECPF